MDQTTPPAPTDSPMDSASMPQVSPSPQNGGSYQRHVTPRLIISVIVLLLLAGGAYAGIWYWGNHNAPCPPSHGGPLEDITPCQNDQIENAVREHHFSASVSPTPDISTWKTYTSTDTEHGFSFKYPSDWQISEKSVNGKDAPLEIVSVNSPANIAHWKATTIDPMKVPVGGDDIQVSRFKIYNEFDSWSKDISAAGSPLPDSPKAITFQDLPAYQSTLKDYGFLIEISYHRVGLDIVFMNAMKESDLTPIERQILSTFRFTN